MSGRIRVREARNAVEEYTKFRVTQDAIYVSDFDAFNAASQRAIEGHDNGQV